MNLGNAVSEVKKRCRIYGREYLVIGDEEKHNQRAQTPGARRVTGG